MLKVTVVRHGQSAGNAAGRYCGWTDVPLTEDGALAVRELAAAGLYPPAGLRFCSPLARCRQTYGAAYGEGAAPPVLLDGLREAYFGEREGTAYPPDGVQGFAARWVAGGRFPDAPHLETCAHLRGRAMETFAQVVGAMRREGAGEAVLFTHGFWIRGLITSLMGWDASHWYDFPVPNALGYVLELDDGAPRGRVRLARAEGLGRALRAWPEVPAFSRWPDGEPPVLAPSEAPAGFYPVEPATDGRGPRVL